MARDAHAGRQRLQGDAALDQPRHVDVPDAAAAQEVATVEQGVGMQVDHVQRGVELARPCRDHPRRSAGEDVEASLDTRLHEPPAHGCAGGGTRGDCACRRGGC